MEEDTKELIQVKINQILELVKEAPLNVLSIFNDFFGEERVDIQNIVSMEAFKKFLYNRNVYNYIPDSCECKSAYRGKSISYLPDEILIDTLDEIIRDPSKLVYEMSRGGISFVHILVHFPHVTITNEFGRSTNVKNLWARVKVDYRGSIVGTFMLTRTEYSTIHLLEGYIHSHVPRAYDLEFKTPCLGSGPIRNTIISLSQDYNEDLWKLFCYELSKWITVESLSGGPYIRLETLGGLDSSENSFKMCYQYYCNTDNIDLESFIKHFINRKLLRFSYSKGSYSLGMSYTEYMTLISNEFISWYNEQFNANVVYRSFESLLEEDSIINKVIIKDNIIYYRGTGSNNTLTNLLGHNVLTFKGKDIPLSVSSDSFEESQINYSIILDRELALYILTKILIIVNYRYGRDTNTKKDIARVSGKVRFL